MKLNIVCPHCLKINRIPVKESYLKANCGTCKKSLLETKPIEADADTLGTILANSNLPVVVDFWAPWCGPCLQMAPAFTEVSMALSLKAQCVKVNTQEHEVLGGQYSIKSIPTLIMFKNAKEINRVSGALSVDQLQTWIRQNS